MQLPDPPEPGGDFESQNNGVEIILSLVLSLGAVLYMMSTEAAPWRWLVELQLGWFDGSYYPKATGGVLFIGALCVIGPIISWLGSLIRRR